MHHGLCKNLTGPAARAYYAASIPDFLSRTEDEIVAALVKGSAFAIELTQRDAWIEQVRVMQSALHGENRDGLVAFEFAVPRMGKRIDVLLVLGAAVYVIEFKVGTDRHAADAMNQVWGYALDMKNFHSTSHHVRVVPVLVATDGGDHAESPIIVFDSDHVCRPVKATSNTLREVLKSIDTACPGPPIDGEWGLGTYKPTPTIIEAAMALYGGHNVADISRREADAVNLTQTSQSIDEIIRSARANSRKAICFVTGVPGAGKTLVGLDIATKHQDRQSELYSVFLSGNGPLVAVLCEALARDKVRRLRAANMKAKLVDARSEVKAFIQNVHHFRDQCIRDAPQPPIEHVALFDEAQRAWNLAQTQSFMQRKKKIPDFAMSEPHFLISCMDRHKDWAVVVCLVGGGQEINTGEAGIGEWLRVVRSSFPTWEVHLSPHLRDSEYAAGDAIVMLDGHANVHTQQCLHLSVSMRSFRAESVSGWVKSVLDLDRAAAIEAIARFRDRYPIALTRDLAQAKAWVRRHARANERFGMVVSSQAQRLKPHAIDVRVDIDPVHWFLDDRDDVRSSFYLEDAATEFHVQGLELDWSCVVWDGDMRHASDGWKHWSFKGSRWQRIRPRDRQSYQKNAYRVLLTRARQGMVIVVPEGACDDPTRSPEFYDSTFEYLAGTGLQVL